MVLRCHAAVIRKHWQQWAKRNRDSAVAVIMKTNYVWIIFFLATIYAVYYYDYQKTLLTKFHFLHVDLLAEFFGSVPEKNDESLRLFTKEEISVYSNLENGLYLAILGQVYDVTRGEKHYGPGGSYQAFVGRDASLAFITGDFSDEGLTDDVSSLSPQQTKSLHDWTQFYAKDYIYKGKLVGRYYDDNGNPTKAYREMEEKLALAEKAKSDEEQRMRLFPPCNIEWKSDVGTRLWCSKRSGGIERDWVGVPRMLYERDMQQHRCTCVNLKSKDYEMHKGNMREYEGCAKGSTICVVKNS